MMTNANEAAVILIIHTMLRRSSNRFCIVLYLFFVIGVDTTMARELVTVENGELLGKLNKETQIRAFKGIPFAAPPVGDLRWQPPQPTKNWVGVLDALDFANRPMQNPIYDDMIFRSNDISEDCLYLNVWSPKQTTPEGLPVLLYFYGGGFVAGDASEPRYDGASMARKDIVVITANYRLGLFGLMAHPELSNESGYQGSGNYTFLDQAAALQWAVKNVAAFGGDPKRITIAGESAGSLSVSGLMASSLSKGLIASAIGESGSLLGPTLRTVPLQQAESNGEQLAKALGNEKPLTLKELRDIPARELLDRATKAGFVWFMPTIDGYFLRLPVEKIYAANQHAQVPLLAGVNSQESSYTEILGDDSVTIKNYLMGLKRLYPEHAEQVFALYPASNKEQIKDAAQALASDRFMGYSTWNWVNWVTPGKHSDTFYYLFNKIRPASIGSETLDSGARGALHSVEIEYALGNLDVNKVYRWQREDYQVSKLMQDYFANFIKYGNPNSQGLPKWPKFSDEKQLIIDTKSTAADISYLRKRYEFHRAYHAQAQRQN
jgi:para-nitrobenzyl esterase